MRHYRGMTKEGKWVEGFLVGVGLYNDIKYILPFQKTDGAFPSPVLCDGEISIWGFIEVIPETVGQSTGLKDKNGKEIYEGDIIEFPEPDERTPSGYRPKMIKGHIGYNEGAFVVLDNETGLEEETWVPYWNPDAAGLRNKEITMITEKEVLQTVGQSELEICEYVETQANILVSKLKEFLEEEINETAQKIIKQTIESKIKTASQAEARKQICELILSIFP